MPSNPLTPKLVDPLPPLPRKWNCPFCPALAEDGQRGTSHSPLDQNIVDRNNDQEIFSHLHQINHLSAGRRMVLMQTKRHMCRYAFSLSNVDRYASCEDIELYWNKEWIPIDTILLGQLPKRSINLARNGFSILNFLTQLNSLCYSQEAAPDRRSNVELSWDDIGVQPLTFGVFIGTNQWFDQILKLPSVDLFCLFNIGAYRNPCSSLADTAFKDQICESLDIPETPDDRSRAAIDLNRFPLTNFDLEHLYQFCFFLLALEWVFNHGKTHKKLRHAFKFLIPKLTQLLDKLEDGCMRYFLPLEKQETLNPVTERLIREFTLYRVEGEKEQIEPMLEHIRKLVTRLNSPTVEPPSHFVNGASPSLLVDAPAPPPPPPPAPTRFKSLLRKIKRKKKK